MQERAVEKLRMVKNPFKVNISREINQIKYIQIMKYICSIHIMVLIITVYLVLNVMKLNTIQVNTTFKQLNTSKYRYLVINACN